MWRRGLLPSRPRREPNVRARVVASGTVRRECEAGDGRAEDVHSDRGPTLTWMHYQVQRLDAPLFRRIVRHVRAGRWHVVNGWWVQPDCNLPGPESFLKQSEVGGKFFKEAFGIKVTVGYNVDSFGHCAMLPTYLRRGGKDSYVFSRPGPHEMKLPANLFRWRPAGRRDLSYVHPLASGPLGTSRRASGHFRSRIRGYTSTRSRLSRQKHSMRNRSCRPLGSLTARW